MNRDATIGLWRQIVYIAAGLVLGGLGLYFALRDVDGDTVLATLRAVRPGWLILAVLCVVGVALLKSARWYRLFVPDHYVLDWRSLLSVLILAQVTNVIVPVRGAGEMLRVGLTTRRFPVGALRVSGTIVVEKLVDLLALSGIVFVSAPLVTQVVGQPGSSATLWLLMMGVLVAMMLTVRFYGPLRGWLGRWPVAARYLAQLLDGFNALRSVASIWELVGWTVAVWVLSLASLLWTLRATCVNIPVWGGLLLLLLLNLGFSLPTPPGLIGMVQYVCVLVLTFFGVTSGQALGTGIVLHLVLVLPLLLLAAPAWFCLGRELL